MKTIIKINRIIVGCVLSAIICSSFVWNVNAVDMTQLPQGDAMIQVPAVPVPEVPSVPENVPSPVEAVVPVPAPAQTEVPAQTKESGKDKDTTDKKKNEQPKKTDMASFKEYDDEMNFNEPEQVFDEDKEAIVEDNARQYPKWQGSRKKPVKNHDYYIKVNKSTCTVTIYTVDENEKLTPYKAMVCSIGREGHDTPEGKGYRTSDYYDWRLMVDNTYGRYAVRFNGSIMFHSVPYFKSKKNSLEWQDYNKLGKPASLGCIRLAVADAKWIFDNCKRGTGVEVYSGPASTDPLGTPDPIKLDTKSEYRDWDPTDLTPENPWLVPVE